MPKAKGSETINVLEISQGKVTFGVVGTTPLIFNRMAEKARRQLLLPRVGRMTDADKAANMKHNPIEEYRGSVNRSVGDKVPTRLLMPAPAFKGAMATAALDLPGTKKTEIGRLTWVEGYSVNVWGVPKLRMDVVRMADIGKTPDIRTRACLSEWACMVTVNFVRPKLNSNAIGNLMAAAGITCGVGDFRQEKGKGSFGQYRLVDEGDADLQRIMKTGGRAAQDAALLKPECYDADTEELLTWFSAEVVKLSDQRDEKKPAKRRAA